MGYFHLILGQPQRIDELFTRKRSKQIRKRNTSVNSKIDAFTQVSEFQKEEVKRELLYIPFWGWALSLLNPIAINRGKPKEAILQTLDEGSKRLEEGMFVLLFPEGTRVEAGKVGNYARSSFELAKRNGVKVLPVCHNSGDCWPAHKFIKHSGVIKLLPGK